MDIVKQAAVANLVLEFSFPYYVSFNYVDNETDEVLYSADIHKDTLPEIIKSLEQAYKILDSQTVLMN